MQESKRAAIYCRVSQDRTGAGLAVERQEHDCRQLAGERGHQVVRVYADNDKSATSGKKRPQFEQLLHDIEAGRVDVVVAWHTDRLYRLPADLERLARAIQARSVLVETCTAGPLDLNTPAGLLGATVHAAVARHEVQQKALRQQAQTDELAREGRRPSGGPRPFGYLPGGVELDPRESQLVREATRRVIHGGSLMSIIREWNAAGVRTSRGGEWSYSSLTAVLTRWRNAAVRQHRGEVLAVRGQWEPIVSRDELEQVRAVLSDPSRRTTSGSARKHLLSFILRCGRCGSTLRAGQTSSRGRTYTVYQCHGPSGCRLAVDYSVAEDVVVGQVGSRLAAPDSGLLQLTSATRSELDQLRRRRAELAAEEREVQAAKVSRRIRMRELEIIEQERAQLDEQIDTALRSQALARLLSEQLPVFIGSRASIDAAVEARAEVVRRFQGLDLDTRRQVVRALCEVTVHPATRGIRPTKATARERIEVVPLDVVTGKPWVEVPAS